jgi:hypothetical protein
MSEYLMKDGSFFVVSGLREAGVSLPEWLFCGVGKGLDNFRGDFF